MYPKQGTEEPVQGEAGSVKRTTPGALRDQSGSIALLLRECVWTLVSAKQRKTKPSKQNKNASTDIDDIDPMRDRAWLDDPGEVRAGLQETTGVLLLLWQCRMTHDYCKYRKEVCL